MKLFKLSLVAALAAGALATTASAVPLEEAIKDVDVSGMTRVRYTYTDEDGEDGSSKWNFKGVLNTKVKVDDNFFALVGLRYVSNDFGAADDEKKTTTSKFKESIDVAKAYFGAQFGNTIIQLGRQDIGAFFTDDMYGDGIKVLNLDVPGLILAGLWMDSLEADSDIGTLGVKALGHTDVVQALSRKKVTDHNLWGVAAIGSYDPVSFQLWYANLQDVTGLFAVELAGQFNVSDDFTLGLKGQYAFADFDGAFKNAVPVSDSNFWGIEASTEFFGVDFSAGYVSYEADKKNTVSLSSFEDQGSFISPGEELLTYNLYSGENNFWFITAGYSIPNSGVRVGVDYVDGTFSKNGLSLLDFDENDASEVVARVDYKYNSKLKFQTWYSHINRDFKNGGDADEDTYRFEAKYSF